VRAALLESWPGLTHYFDIKPLDVGRYSVAELEQYVAALAEIDAEARRHR
jgi:hypothetical protein